MRWAWVLALLGGGTAALVLRAIIERWQRKHRARRAQRGERAAERLLVAAGYRVLTRQARASVLYDVDGESIAFDVRADLLLEKGGRRFVAEVKTGREAPQLSTAATRRQLLEYELAFDADAVLLVDADAERIHRIGVPRRASPRARWLATGLAVGLALGLALARYLA